MNLLNYVPGSSFLHRLNPITKLAGAFLYGIACILCNSIPMELIFILLMILISATAGLFQRAIRLTRNLLVLGLFMFVLQLFFVRTGDPLVTVKNFTLITTGGLISALLLSLRVVATMLPLMILFGITSMNDLCNALVKKLHLPYRYAFIVTTAFRFVPLFATEFHDIEDAQKARGVDFETKNLIRKVQLVAPLCVPLLVSSLKKVTNSAISAELRGFALRDHTSGYKDYPFLAGDLITWMIVLALVVFSAIFL
jgi:energy-coupling factor transport system permease protein